MPLNPWMMLGALVAALGIALGAFFYGEHVDGLGWKAQIAAQKTEAQKQLADAQAAIVAQVKAVADANDRIEATHAKDQKVIDDAYVAYSNLLAERVQPRRGNGSANATSTAAANPGGSSQPAVDGVIVSKQALGDLGTLARDADYWRSYGEACHAWAVSVGR